jgi:hypothetical protein
MCDATDAEANWFFEGGRRSGRADPQHRLDRQAPYDISAIGPRTQDGLEAVVGIAAPDDALVGARSHHLLQRRGYAAAGQQTPESARRYSARCLASALDQAASSTTPNLRTRSPLVFDTGRPIRRTGRVSVHPSGIVGFIRPNDRRGVRVQLRRRRAGDDHAAAVGAARTVSARWRLGSDVVRRGPGTHAVDRVQSLRDCIRDAVQPRTDAPPSRFGRHHRH